MNKFFSFLILFCFCSCALFAQNTYSIKGRAIDSISHVKLTNTTIVVLNAKDSIMRKFTRATENGSFSIDNLAKGKFILLVSFPGYADYVEHFSLDSANKSHDFGTLDLKLKSRILQEVLVKGTASQIKIKGDTTEYNAKAFVIQPNSKVEDLLKQLPGIQVDKDGKITAQGQAVSKVLVDGEEFFGDDPTLVTKNIRGDMVDKVQLYDKKSDQATFTGIDDGQKTKTINIKLKEDKKNGYFGKVDAGAGTDNYYQLQALFNRFKAKKKFSAYTTISNNGKTGLGWQDNQKYGSSDNIQFGDDGNSIFFFGGGGGDLDSFNGQYSGKGIPIAITGGLHYDEKFANDKASININFKTGSLAIDGTESTLTQNNLPTGTINTVNDQKFHDFMFRQKLDAVYQVKLDTSSNLKVSVDGTTKHSNNTNSYVATSRRGNDTLLNTSDRNLTNTVDAKVFDASIFYTKKFKKPGRTFSLNVSEAYNESQAKGFLKTDINYFDAQGKPDSSQKVDQYKTTDTKSSVLNTNITYTEPLSKYFSVIVNYGLGVNNSTADRKSFNLSAPGIYNVLDSIYSNNYKLNQLINQAGAVFNYKKGKTIFNFGSKVSDVSFKQANIYTGTLFKRHFIDWYPQATYQYRFTQQSSFRFYYNGSTAQPTVDQIQPVVVNTDPLNITLGNPNLTPSFTNRFNIGYNSYKVLTDQSLWINSNFSFTSNPIVTSTITNSGGQNTNQYINLPNRTPYNFNASVYYGQKLQGTGLNVGFDVNFNGNKSYNLSNTELNALTLNTYEGSLRLSKYVEKKYDFNVSFGPNYSIGGSSLQHNINNNGHGLNGDAGFTFYLPGKFQISSDANYLYNSKTQTFNQDFSRILWNAYLIKTLNKAENLKLTLICNDILNQNAGFTRSISGNLISEDRYTTIRRYFMLTLVWDFNKMGGGVPKK